MVEVWTCTGPDEWTVAGGQPMVCPTPRMAFCNYPHWTIPGVGSENRCDHSEPCTKHVKNWEQLFGATAEDPMNVVCDSDESLVEVWTCTGPDEWTVAGGQPMVCPTPSTPRMAFCNYPHWTIPG